MTIRLTTLGGLRVHTDDRELDRLPGQNSRAALLVYLAVEREVSRESLITVFWPESDAKRGRHALRQSLYHLRGVLGDGWIESRSHELRVESYVRTDTEAFTAALERGDPESAAKLYEGPFLDGIHLVDLASWETWVDAQRGQYARDFRKGCRAWVRERRAAGDLEGAIAAAERWVAPDPLDDEAQHTLIRTLAEAGERAEAIRQYDAYVRAIEVDGLRPLEETRELVEGLGREAVILRGLDTTQRSARTQPAGARREGAGPERVPPAHPVWKRNLLGAAAISVLLLVLVAGYLGSRENRSSPNGSLVARGAIDPGERIVLADFASIPTDSALAAVVTEALRIDLVATPILRIVERSEVREILDRMQEPEDRVVSAELAREVALREGVKAVLEGHAARAGTGHVLTATLRMADTGESLAAFRETAESDGDLIPAIDRLSRRIREGVGESLSSVHATPPLERVTTSSLDALRLLTQASQAFDRGEYDRVIFLLEDAVELDPEFAMAWRRLAVALRTTETDHVRELEAATKAYELRHLLTPRERYLASARYHAQVTHDRDAMIHAYRRVLDIDPDDRVALNNLAGEYLDRQDFDAAGQLLQRAVEGPGASPVAFINLITVRIAQGELEEGDRTVEAFAKRYPTNRDVPFWRFWVLLLQGDEQGARLQMEPLADDPNMPHAIRARAHDHLARLALWRGGMGKAREHLEAAERVGEQVGPAYLLVRRLFRAHAEVAVGDPDRGHRLLRGLLHDEMLVDLDPADRWHFLRAIVYAMAGRAGEADDVLREFEEEVPSEFHDQFRVRNQSAQALVLLQQGDPDGAIQVLEEIRISRQCRACFAERMGWALREAGRLEEAANEWESALAWDDFYHSIEWQFTQNLWVLQRLPSLYEELGDAPRAVEHYRRLVEVWANADPELQARVREAHAKIATLDAG